MVTHARVNGRRAARAVMKPKPPQVACGFGRHAQGDGAGNFDAEDLDAGFVDVQQEVDDGRGNYKLAVGIEDDAILIVGVFSER